MKLLFRYNKRLENYRQLPVPLTKW